MISPFSPLLRINKAWLADSQRVVKDRLPGAFTRLVNIVPNLSDGIGQLRTGYQIFNSTNDGINFNLGDGWTTEVPFVFPIQHPSDSDFYVLCQKDGSSNKRVVTYPDYYSGGTNGSYTPFNDSIISGDNVGNDDEFTYDAVDQRIINYTNAARAAAGLANTNALYVGWVVYNVTRSNYAIVKTYAVSGGAAVVTFVENVHDNGNALPDPSLDWITTDVLVWIKNFHDNPYNSTYFSSGFNPTYNDDKANPPCANVQNSIVRFSGGQGTTFGLRGVHITPKLTRTFFPDAPRTLSIARTYIAERELKQPNSLLLLNNSTPISTQDGSGATETVIPNNTQFTEGPALFAGVGSAALNECVDEGAVANDADYIQTTYLPFGGNSGNYIIGMAPLAGIKDENGQTTFHIRYKIDDDGTGYHQYLQFKIGDNSGVITTQLADAINTGGWQVATITVNNNQIDPDSWYVRILFEITTASPGSAFTLVSQIYATADVLVDNNPLTVQKTYWVGIAPVYDGFQIGNLVGVETVADYVLDSGEWTGNFLRRYGGYLKVNFRMSLARLNKRITGFALYIAVDDGQTLARKSEYQYMKHVSITQTDYHSALWTFDNATGTFNLVVTINQADVNAVGNTFIKDAGYIPDALDTMYAYSTEEIVSNRRMMANVYVGGESAADRTNIFTNPTGANPDINSGIIQPDVFSNEEAVYRLRVDPLVGTKINVIVGVGVDEFLIIKDRGIINARLVMVGDTPDIIQTVISRDVGAATVNSYAKDDDGVLYFNGYDDIYAYKNGQLTPLIERPDKNDWLYTYQDVITSAQKEASTIFWQPEIKSVIFLFGVEKAGSTYAGLQFLFHRGLWSEISLYDSTFNNTPDLSMRWVTQLRNGHVLATSTESTPGFYRMGWKYAAGVYHLTYTDDNNAGTSIGVSPYFDTGDLLGGDESTDILMRKLVINRTLSNTPTLAGSLDVTVFNENGTGYSKTAISSSDSRITCKFGPLTRRKGQSWRTKFNVATSGRERISAGNYQINSIEIFGEKIPRIRSTGK